MNKIKYRSLSSFKYQLLESYSCHLKFLRGLSVKLRFLSVTKRGKLTVKRGYAWDGPSGPTIDTDSFMRGSLVHDALYQLMREEKVKLSLRKEADKVLYDICLQDGMGRFRAWYVYINVRLFGARSATPSS